MIFRFTLLRCYIFTTLVLYMLNISTYNSKISHALSKPYLPSLKAIFNALYIHWKCVRIPFSEIYYTEMHFQRCFHWYDSVLSICSIHTKWEEIWWYSIYTKYFTLVSLTFFHQRKKYIKEFWSYIDCFSITFATSSYFCIGTRIGMYPFTLYYFLLKKMDC